MLSIRNITHVPHFQHSDSLSHSTLITPHRLLTQRSHASPPQPPPPPHTCQATQLWKHRQLTATASEKYASHHLRPGQAVCSAP
mmetsp:Transcript_59372/g.132228  ORF Transcript_59372/g.132228 Transcript_59372/m.132228 type:complete len:84 (+) Transcript_59372:116-367(+)